MLEREGESVTKKSNLKESINDNEESEKKDDDTKEQNNESSVSSGEESDEDGGFFEENPQKSRYTPKTQKRDEKHENDKKKALSHTEKLELIKERKRQKREQMDQTMRQKTEDRERKGKARQKHKEMMNQFTRRGQPKMGPRITRLLDQIKDMQ